MLVAREANKCTFLTHFFRAAIFLIKFGVVVFAFRSWTKSKWIYKLYGTFWILHLVVVLLYTLLYDVHREDFNMDGLIIFFYYISQLLAHLVIVLESVAKEGQRENFELLFADFEKRFLKDLDIINGDSDRDDHDRYEDRDNDYRLAKRQGLVLVILSCLLFLSSLVYGIISYAFLSSGAMSNIIYWHSLPSSIALVFRVFEVIVDVTALNEYATRLRYCINDLGERNIRDMFGSRLSNERRRSIFVAPEITYVKPFKRTSFALGLHRQPNDEADAFDERRLRACKRFYSDLYKLYKLINHHFGWSLLAFIIMYYILFVTNSYWLVFALIVRSGIRPSLLSILPLLAFVIPLLWIVLWLCQNSQEQSHQISSIMFKIVKPAASKSYHDLVTDFSLQTLHQQYIITAKDFVHLNLNLLGKMAASIVTYLVILIQFMIAGKGTVDRGLLAL